MCQNTQDTRRLHNVLQKQLSSAQAFIVLTDLGFGKHTVKLHKCIVSFNFEKLKMMFFSLGIYPCVN